MQLEIIEQTFQPKHLPFRYSNVHITGTTDQTKGLPREPWTGGQAQP